VLGDEWLDFAQVSVANYLDCAKGFVYLVSSRAQPQLLKIGKTKLHPLERLKSLNSAGVADILTLKQAWPVHDRHWVELACHTRLKREGLWAFKEFFTVSEDYAVSCLQAALVADKNHIEAQGLHVFNPKAGLV
jgi:hypothetical protein